MRIISYGGGVQSTAMVIMAAKRDPDFEKACGGPIDAAVFSNVGDDSEQPHTLKYVREIIIPWADSLGFPVEIVNKTKKDGTEAETLMQKMMKDGSVSFPIPIRIGDGRPALRACTVDYKIKVIEKYVRQHGATKDNKAVVAIGISIDEFQRIASNRESNYETKIYPLIDLNMNRADCQAVPESVGLPRPGKSACFFCPFHRAMEWSELRRDQPELFQKSLELENRINEVRKAQDKDPAYLTSRGKPLDQAIGEAQDQLPGFESIEEAGCDSGHCFT